MIDPPIAAALTLPYRRRPPRFVTPDELRKLAGPIAPGFQPSVLPGIARRGHGKDLLPRSGDARTSRTHYTANRKPPVSRLAAAPTQRLSGVPTTVTSMADDHFPNDRTVDHERKVI
jgi:hypothetical protein